MKADPTDAALLTKHLENIVPRPASPAGVRAVWQAQGSSQGGGRVNAITELERDILLIEDVLGDADQAWGNCLDIPLTPRSLERLVTVKVRLDAVADEVRNLQVGVHKFVTAAKKELR